MFHPLEGDLSQFKDNEIEEKLLELNKKYYQAARLGNQDLLTQVATFVTIYREELNKRLIKKTQKELGGDLDQLINVD
jgi:hypothetical protein